MMKKPRQKSQRSMPEKLEAYDRALFHCDHLETLAGLMAGNVTAELSGLGSWLQHEIGKLQNDLHRLAPGPE